MALNIDPTSCFFRDALTKMKDVYIKNPQMGDPTSVDPRLTEIATNIEKLQSEVQKFEVGVRRRQANDQTCRIY